MRLSILTIATAFTSTLLVAQDPVLEVTNFRGVVSTATHPTTGARYPWGPTTPPGYTATAGVAPGTRAWTYTPQTRMRAGHQRPNYLTLTGMTQVIMIGAGTTSFASVYQFMTGIGPAMQVPVQEGYRHATTGPDILSFPAVPIVVTSITNFRASFTLSTPVAVPEVPLVLFVEYAGGEQQNHATLGQTIAADWRGGPMFRNGVYYGFTVGQNPRTVTVTLDNLYRGQIGMIVKEPQFTATGFHANNYDPNPPLTNEDYRGLAAAFPDDWLNFTSPLASLFFYLDGGGALANGNATVLMNWARSTPFAGRIASPFGLLMLNPIDPLLTALPDAGVVLPLDTMGRYVAGPSVPIAIRKFPPVANNTHFEFQAIGLDANNSQIVLFNKSSMLIH